jgi:putative redox protein
MARQNFAFSNDDGEQLAGVLETPADGDIRAVALFAHCFTCTKNIRAAANIAGALAAQGIACLRFDFTGLGESEGDFASSGFSANVADLVAAAQALGDAVGAPSLLVGHSLGGTAVLMAARQIPSCEAVATIGSPGHAGHVMHLLAENVDEIRAHGQATVKIGGRPFQMKQSFLADLEAQPEEPRLADLDRALLVMHSPLDKVVGIDQATAIFGAAKHPKSFVSLDRADHLLSDAGDAAYAAQVIAAWAARYLPDPSGDDAEDETPGVTAVTYAGSFHTEIKAGQHRLLADEPASVGGENTGPTPYGLLSASLAACTTMTLQMYAKRKKLALEAAEVTVEHQKIHAQDCEHCESAAGRIDRFDKRIRLTGELTDEQRKRLLEIADMCPVHRTLHSEVVVATRED